MPRLIVTDLDGTLLTEDRVVSSDTIDTFRRLSALGNFFAIASGRHYVDVRGVRDALGVPAYIISSNGALAHGPDDSLLYERHIDATVVRTILKIQLPSAIVRNVYTSAEWLIDRESPELLALNPNSGFKYLVTPLEDFSGRQVTKLDFVGKPAELKKLEEVIGDQCGNSVATTYSRPGCFEVMASGVSKGVALTSVMELMEVKPDAVLAFGDNLNDIEMLRVASNPHVMGNAHPKLFELFPKAKHIGHNNEDAVAVTLRQLLLSSDQSSQE